MTAQAVCCVLSHSDVKPPVSYDCVAEVCGVRRGYTNTIECVAKRKPAWEM